jgi:hypothetical protein
VGAGDLNSMPPFKRIPGIMIMEMVHASNFWLNMFPAHDGVSASQSPCRIMTGQQGDYALHCGLQYGEYVQVHESHDNSMNTRTTGAIVLRPTGNVQGGLFFFSLMTGKCLDRFDWTRLPMPGEVIDRIHALTHQNPAGGDVQFGWRDGTPIEDAPNDEGDAHNEDYNPNEDDNSDNDGYDPPGHPVAGVGTDIPDNYNDTDNNTNDICGAQGHAEPHWRNNVNGEGSGIFDVHLTKAQHQKLHRSRACGS